MTAIPLGHVAVHLRPEDNIAVAAKRLEAGVKIQHLTDTLEVTSRIGMGHKIALGEIKKGEAIHKYGQIIGFASEDIPAGSHVHVHNVAADTFERDYAFCRDCASAARPDRPRGISRATTAADGRFGTRNYIAIISTVNCSASTSKYISDKIRATDLLKQFPERRRRRGDHAQGGLRHAV